MDTFCCSNMWSKTRGVHANCGYRCVDICFPLGVLDMGKCCANQVSFSKLTNLWSYILCPKPDGNQWHEWGCLMGDYTLCGI
jgi:hypothetical protein